MERFAGVNVRGFNPIEVFVEILSLKTFRGTLKIAKVCPANLSVFKVYSLSRAWGVG